MLLCFGAVGSVSDTPPLPGLEPDPPPVVEAVDPAAVPAPDLPPETVTLVLVPVADPAARHGLAERPVEDRLAKALKALLRQHGLRAVVVRCPTPDEILHAAEWL